MHTNLQKQKDTNFLQLQPRITTSKTILADPFRLLRGQTPAANDDEILYQAVCRLFHRQGLMADMTRGALHQGRIDFYVLGCPGKRVSLMLTHQPWKAMPEHQDAEGQWHPDLTRRHHLRDIIEHRMNFGHDLEESAQAAWNDLCHNLEEIQKQDGSFFLILLDPQKYHQDQILLFDGTAFDNQPRRLRLVHDPDDGPLVLLEAAETAIDPFGDRYDPAWQLLGKIPAGILMAAEAYSPGRLYEFMMRPF